MATHISDIGKEARDVLTLDYPNEGTFKWVIQTKPDSAFTVKATINRGVKKEKNHVYKDIASAVFEPKLELKQHNLELNVKFSTQNDFSGSAVVKDVIGHGSKLELIGTQNEREGANGTLAVSSKKEFWATKGSISYPFTSKKQPIKFNGEVVIFPNNVLLGAAANVKLEGEKSVAAAAEAVVGYSAPNYQLKARGSHTLGSDTFELGFSILNQSPKHKLAADVTTDKTLQQSTFACGGEWKIDDFSTIKSKWALKNTPSLGQADLRWGLALKQKITPKFSASLAGDFNLRSLFLGGDSGEIHSFGFEAKYTDEG